MPDSPTAAPTPDLPDTADRHRAITDTGATLLVDAGAGAGKTSVLVARICRLVAEGVPIRNVAAVTFTESAASELRDRVRAGLARLVTGGDPTTRQYAQAAVADLDAAAIGTLHAFARRILAEHPIEAGLPPVVEVLDEVASGVRTDRWWRTVRTELLQDDTLSPALLVLSALGMQINSFRPGQGLEGLMNRLQADWDLLEDHPVPTRTLPDRLDVTSMSRTLTQLADLAATCRDPDDPLAVRLAQLQTWGEQLAAADGIAEQVQIWSERPSVKVSKTGRAPNWSGKIASVRSLVIGLGDEDGPFTAAIADAVWQVVARLGAEVINAAEQRRRDGQLMYQDLLVLARRLLRTNAAVRAELHDKYPRLLLDEFQDTDPIQIELAVRIAAGASGDAADWRDIAVPAGSLFVVGDAKQSIYRFRRADIATFMAAADFLGSSNRAALSTNFRSHRAVLDWINGVFADLIVAAPDVQPAYTALDAAPTREHPDDGPRVFTLPTGGAGARPSDAQSAADGAPSVEAAAIEAGAGQTSAGEAPDDEPRVLPLPTGSAAAQAPAELPAPAAQASETSAGKAAKAGNAGKAAKRDKPGSAGDSAALASDEARQVADVIATALTEQWPMPAGRSITPADITILVPSRGSLNVLEESLRAVGVPYRLMARSLIYGSDAIRDLLLVLRAADDPGNELLVVEALRTPILGCGDNDLLTWFAAGGRWAVGNAVPESLPGDHPVAVAMSLLDELRKQRRTLSPSQLLAQIVSRRNLLAVAAVGADARDVWRRYRIVIDQARQWAETAHGTLREYLAWAVNQSTDEDRANDLALPETDADAVTVMTVHAAKGLEFAMVVVSGMSSQVSSGVGQVLWTPEGAQVCLRAEANLNTEGWDSAKSLESDKLAAEVRRLLYVACTRAQEYLVVSTVEQKRSRAEILLQSSAVASAPQWKFRGLTWHAEPVVAEVQLPAESDWQTLYDRQVSAAAQRVAVSAGAIAHGEVPQPAGLLDIDPGLAKGARDLELPAWLKGRYGTAIGRAVHATLQTVDLATGDGLYGAAEGQALVEGLADQADLVATLTQSAFASSVVRLAATREHFKETYVGGSFDGSVVEGFIDLLFADDDGNLVVVDYKTDGSADADTLQAYRRQLHVYATLLQQATGRTVSRRVLVFCTNTGPAAEVEV